AVRAEEAHDLALVHGERDLVHRAHGTRLAPDEAPGRRDETGLPLGDVEDLQQPVDVDRVLHQPLRFSFPCRFAYTSPRRNTHSPSGTETAPMTRSGQMSPQRPVRGVPSRIAARAPSRAYVAGEIFASICIHSGRTLTG